jgi:hypothetical protein
VLIYLSLVKFSKHWAGGRQQIERVQNITPHDRGQVRISRGQFTNETLQIALRIESSNRRAPHVGFGPEPAKKIDACNNHFTNSPSVISWRC